MPLQSITNIIATSKTAIFPCPSVVVSLQIPPINTSNRPVGYPPVHIERRHGAARSNQLSNCRQMAKCKQTSNATPTKLLHLGGQVIRSLAHWLARRNVRTRRNVTLSKQSLLSPHRHGRRRARVPSHVIDLARLGPASSQCNAPPGPVL